MLVLTWQLIDHELHLGLIVRLEGTASPECSPSSCRTLRERDDRYVNDRGGRFRATKATRVPSNIDKTRDGGLPQPVLIMFTSLVLCCFCWLLACFAAVDAAVSEETAGDREDTTS